MGTRDTADKPGDGTEGAAPPPPSDLPQSASAFYVACYSPTPPVPEGEGTSALDRLGSSPLPRTKFPFIGFMASLYEHVSAQALAAMDGRFVYVEPPPPEEICDAVQVPPDAMPATPAAPPPMLRTPLRAAEALIGTSLDGPEEAPGFYRGRVSPSRWAKENPNSPAAQPLDVTPALSPPMAPPASPPAPLPSMPSPLAIPSPDAEPTGQPTLPPQPPMPDTPPDNT